MTADRPRARRPVLEDSLAAPVRRDMSRSAAPVPRDRPGVRGGAALLAAALGVLLACRPRASAPPDACTGALTDLAWLAGAWERATAQARQVERWGPPEGTTMLGTGQLVRAGRTEFFEFLRVEARADGLVLVAQPAGGAPVEFRRTRCAAGEVRFENPTHDFPRSIAYRRTDDGGLEVRVEGPGRDGGTTGEEYVMRPLRGPR